MVTDDTFGGIPGIPFFLWDFGLMTTHDDMRAGQDYVSWLIWPCGLLILQDFTSRYCLTINCISRTAALKSSPPSVYTAVTPAEALWPVVRGITTQHFLSHHNRLESLYSISTHMSRLLCSRSIRAGDTIISWSWLLGERTCYC